MAHPSHMFNLPLIEIALAIMRCGSFAPSPGQLHRCSIPTARFNNLEGGPEVGLDGLSEEGSQVG